MEFVLNNVRPISIGLSAVASLLVLLYLIVYRDDDMERIREKQRRLLREKDIKRRAAAKTNRQIATYEKNEKFIKSSGLYYMTKGKVNYKQYQMICAVITTLFMLAGYSFAGLLGMIIGAVIGIFAPRLILKANNDQDNSKMLDSIKQVYDTLRIQVSNDIYITDVLRECYITTQHPRLKTAFYELVSEINAKSNINEAVDNFNDKFNNPFIDALSLSIRQSLLTGNASQIFNDISKQVDAIDQAILLREEDRAKRLNTIVQALVYFGILAIVIYFAILAASDLFAIF